MLITLMPLADMPIDDVDALLDSAFGNDRQSRTAYRIREGTAFIPALSFAAVANNDLVGELVGTIQCWPVALASESGRTVPLTMVGPVAVRPDRQREGIGRLLMAHTLAVADSSDAGRAMMLIGDPEYYQRLFGFSANHTSGWRAPGPVDQRRLLARGDRVPATAGMLGPRVSALA